MTISLVSEQEWNGAAVAPIALTGVTASVGDMLVAVAHLQAASDTAVSNVTDSAGNTWVRRVGRAAHTGAHVAIWTCAVTTALTGGTVTITPELSYAYSVNISRWTGILGVGDFAQTIAFAAVTTLAGAPLPVYGYSEICVIGTEGHANGGASTLTAEGWTALTGGGRTSFYGGQAYIITSGGVYQPSWTISTGASYASATLALFGSPLSTSVSALHAANTRLLTAPVQIGQQRTIDVVQVLVPLETESAPVTTTGITTWRVLATATSSAGGTWAAFTTVTAAAGGAWSTFTAVTSSAAASWTLLDVVSAPATGSWAVTVTAATIAAAQWTADAAIETGATATWAQLHRVDGAASATWMIAGPASSTASANWAAQSVVAAAASATWTDEGATTATANARWVVHAHVEHAAGGAWNLHGAVNTAANARYQLHFLVIAHGAATWAADQLPAPHVRAPRVAVQRGDRAVTVRSSERTVDVREALLTVE